jgi:hypothetical protein
MATVTPVKGWGPLQLTTTAASLVLASASATIVINRAVFTNVSDDPCSITVYVVRSGGSVGDATTIISAYNIQPGESYVAPELSGLVLKGGDGIQALAGAATSITTVGSGFSV